MKEMEIMIVGVREYGFIKNTGEQCYGTKVQCYAPKEIIKDSAGKIIKTYDIKNKLLKDEIVGKGLSLEKEVSGLVTIGYNYLTEETEIIDITY